MIQEKNNNYRLKGIMAAIIASALWSTGGIFIKLIDWNPVAIAGSRSFISALLLLAYGESLSLRNLNHKYMVPLHMHQQYYAL